MAPDRQPIPPREWIDDRRGAVAPQEVARDLGLNERIDGRAHIDHAGRKGIIQRAKGSHSAIREKQHIARAELANGSRRDRPHANKLLESILRGVGVHRIDLDRAARERRDPVVILFEARDVFAIGVVGLEVDIPAAHVDTRVGPARECNRGRGVLVGLHRAHGREAKRIVIGPIELVLHPACCRREPAGDRGGKPRGTDRALNGTELAVDQRGPSGRVG